MFTEYILISRHKKGTRHTKGISHQGLKTVLGRSTNLKIEQNTCPGQGIALRKGTDRKFLIQVGSNTSCRKMIWRRLWSCAKYVHKSTDTRKNIRPLPIPNELWSINLCILSVQMKKAWESFNSIVNDTIKFISNLKKRWFFLIKALKKLDEGRLKVSYQRFLYCSN